MVSQQNFELRIFQCIKKEKYLTLDHQIDRVSFYILKLPSIKLILLFFFKPYKFIILVLASIRESNIKNKNNYFTYSFFSLATLSSSSFAYFASSIF